MIIDNLLRLLKVARQNGALKQLITRNTFSISSFELVQALHQYEKKLSTVIDAGANKGQFAIAVSSKFPDSIVHSFEPVPDTFENLVQNTLKIPNINCYNLALGDNQGKIDFYQNNYSHVSSALRIDKENQNPNYERGVKNVLEVPVNRLDNLMDEIDPISSVLLKLDVQGYEKKVIEGAEKCLGLIDYILLEISFVSLYEGQPLFQELNSFLNGLDYEFVCPLSFHKGSENKIIEMDALYKQVK